MNQIKNKLSLLLGCFCSICVFAQLDTYDYKMQLSSVDSLWHTVELPEAVYGVISQNMNDIRLYGVTENDTLEAPYLMKVGEGDYKRKVVDFKILNKTSNANGHYFTYEIPTIEPINLIRLDFENENFDWKIILEGSQNQNEWFTILDDYRILSIQNEQTDYTFNTLKFPDAKYRYYRILIKTLEKPELSNARIIVDKKTKDKFEQFTVFNLEVTQKGKKSILDIDLKKRLPVSYLKINISDETDYYRNFTVEYLLDSVQIEKGWRYNYRELFYGTLNGIEKNEFTFNTTLAHKLRVHIENNDNQPLIIAGVTAKGYVHELHARFSKPATYYLAYGKTNDRKPQYDIVQAGVKIPSELSVLNLGKAQKIPKKAVAIQAPLFENELWLWLVMCLVILVIGGFTIKMMQKK